MATYLITGGAGFIGSHVAERLLRDGHRVTVLDDLSSGSFDNLNAVSASASFLFLEGCITDRGLLAEAVEGVDAIFHLAATVGVLNIIKSPVETIENNINGTQYVLEAAARSRTPVLVASTSEVYGKGNLDYVSLAGVVLAMLLAFWTWRRKFADTAHITAAAFASLPLILGGVIGWYEPFGHPRILSPLYLMLLIAALRWRSPLLAAPLALILPRIALQLAPLLPTLRSLL